MLLDHLKHIHKWNCSIHVKFVTWIEQFADEWLENQDVSGTGVCVIYSEYAWMNEMDHTWTVEQQGDICT